MVFFYLCAMFKMRFVLLSIFLFFSQISKGQITQLNEDFSTCSGFLPVLWQQYSVTGTDSWKCTATGYTDNGVYMNGYSGGMNHVNEDWLISPSLDLNTYSAPHLFFFSRTKFNGNAIEVLVSNNYIGSGNPNIANWTALTVALPTVNSDTWTLSENINLTPFKNQPCYVAFKYTSTAQDAALWRIDNVHIAENALTLNKKFINVGQAAAGFASAGNSYQFTMNGIQGTLTLNAPGPFKISKDNVSFSSQLSYNNTASGIPQTVYVKIYPTIANKVYRDVIQCTYNGNPVKATLHLLGTSMPDDRTLKVANWNMRWFGDPSGCNCDTSLAKSNATTILKDLNADIYCIQELVNINQLAWVTAALGPNYQYIVSPFCSGATNAASGLYPSGQKLAFIYNTLKIQSLGTFGLLASTYPNDTMGYYCFSSGRFPFMMKAKVLLANGGSDTLIIANIHGKAAGTQSDYDRRQCGADKMTDSLNALFASQKIMVIGDYNDYLEGSMVAGNINSPYKYFLDNGFTGISLPSKYPGQSTYVGSTDHIIDNVACTPILYNKYIDSSFFIFTEPLEYIQNFAASTSDHYPCMSYYSYTFPNSLLDQQTTTDVEFKIQNPSSNQLVLFNNDLLKEQTTLTVYDLSGKIIYTTLFNPNGTKVIFNIPHISKGLYFVSLNNSQVKGMQKWIVE